ncbi:MAG: asparagine synthase (glutamine-hydrolyzing) [Flavobacteriales bacterium]|nr:asparagine synthase (glutamine-hydrolyzing) [Flavobacteriales bacterium]
MCGIAGIAGLTGLDAPETLVHAMTEAMAHRGPNARGWWRGPDVVLGHRRLSIIDLSPAGDQPFHSADGMLTIVFNGEIYNYRELRAELGAHHFRTGSDTEVLLAAYAEWGIACLDRLQGMFGFALWDHRTSELHVVRDRLGVKPVYLWRKEGRLAFASELRALLATGLVPRRLDRVALADHLRYQTVHAPSTLVKDVRMLMPGHRLVWKAGAVEEVRWWDPVKAARRDAATMDLPTVQRQVRELLGAAVAKRLVSDVPFGAFLSGGIDSSAVVGLMAQASSTPVHTFSVVFDEERFSEERYARLVAQRFGTKHTAIRLTPADMLRELPGALAAMDHPSGDGPNTYVVSKVTKEAGITMALSGLGGDEVFAGYPVFTRTLRLQRLQAAALVPAALRGLAGDLVAALRGDLPARKLAALARLPGFSPAHTYPLSRLVFDDAELAWLLPGGALPPNAVARLAHQLLHADGGSALPALSQVSLLESAAYMQNVLLRDADQMSMAHALEVRVPFLDHDLVEFVLGVPDALKYPTTPKRLLVDSLGDLLPREIVDRPKMGFTLPWADWMRADLRAFCEERLRDPRMGEVWNAKAVEALWQRFLRGDKATPWGRLWHLVVLADWMRRNAIEG